MSFELLGAFFLASLLLAAVPGPDNIFVLTQSMMSGPKAGLMIVLGLCSGLVIQTTALALGLAAVIAAMPILLSAIKITGAAYLLYLAYMAWIHAHEATEGKTQALSRAALWRRGLIMNLTNPKVQIFFLAFFPQFAPKNLSATALCGQMLLQGMLFILATLLVFGSIALLSGYGALLFKNARARVRLNRMAALIFAGLAGTTIFL